MAERELLPKGKYRAKAVGAEFGTSENGKDYCFVGFEIVGGPHAGESIGAWLYFPVDANNVPTAMAERSIESLRYCGCAFARGDITDTTGLGSTDVQLVVEHDEYQGKVRAKVKWVNKLASGVKSGDEMRPDQRKAFSAKMRGLVLASGGGAPATRTNDEPPPIGDDDIPF